MKITERNLRRIIRETVKLCRNQGYGQVIKEGNEMTNSTSSANDKIKLATHNLLKFIAENRVVDLHRDDVHDEVVDAHIERADVIDMDPKNLAISLASDPDINEMMTRMVRDILYMIKDVGLNK